MNEDTTSNLLAIIHLNGDELWKSWLNGQKPDLEKLDQIVQSAIKLQETYEQPQPTVMYI